MFTRKLVIAASFALVSAGAFAEPGELLIGDWEVEAPTTREQVQAELREATRLGLVTNGEGEIPIATDEQEHQIAKAGQDAVAEQFANSFSEYEG